MCPKICGLGLVAHPLIEAFAKQDFEDLHEVGDSRLLSADTSPTSTLVPNHSDKTQV